MSTRAHGRARLAVLVAPLLVLSTIIGPAGSLAAGPELTARQLEASGRVGGHKASSSGLAQTDPQLLARTDRATVRVVIKLDYDSVASYAGTIAGLAATSPRTTGRPLGDTAEVAQYQAYVTERESAFLRELEQAVPGARVGHRLRTVYGGVAAAISASSVERILAIPGVVAVQYDQLRQPLTDASPEFVNATGAYDDLDTTANAGEGVIYGNIDTGLWPEHPSFADLGNLDAPPARADGTTRTCEFGDNPLTPLPDPFSCQDKLIGGEAFLDTYHAVLGDEAFAGTARDAEGHGTHTASTTAGNMLEAAAVFGVDRGPIHGLAPGAHVIEYRVCGPQGCFSSDSAAAVGEAILDGAEVINFSISGGTSPFTDPVELAFLDAYAAGVFVAASAGNSGPGAGTANHLSPWVATVAASTQTREFRSTLSLAASGGASATLTGASITAGVSSPLPVVLSSAAPYSNELCDAPAPAGLFAGQIVACRRGVIARVDKGFNVLQGGAAGMILYNAALADVETDNHWLPAVHLADGTDFVAFMTANTGVTGSFTEGQRSGGQGDVIAAFSSRGPAGNFIKPDVTAPGVQILAGHSPLTFATVNGPPGELFQAIAGTSMSSPHVAGAAILLADAHPAWTPGEIKSALMTRSTTGVVKQDLTTPADPFDFGAGRIDVGASVDAALTFDETAARYAAMADDPVVAVHLNVPSINAPIMPGRLVTHRIVTNRSGIRQRFVARGLAPEGSAILVSPSRFTLPPNASAVLTIRIRSSATIGEQQFGSVELVSRRGARQHLPVAFIHTQGSVSLTQDCAPASIARGETATCDITAVNNSTAEQVVDLETETDGAISVVSATGATKVNGELVRLSDATLSGARAGVPAVAPGSLFGYIPLDIFGVAPIGVGDEEIVNFSGLPAFEYAGEAWDAIGVYSNGYIVVGGGTAEDNECCNIPPIPNPARPNNILAPFWTDLDGTGAPGIFAAILSDGVNDWIAIEWRVNVFGTTSQRVFQVWIGVNGVEDITFAYDPANLPADPHGQPFQVGAENSAGQGQGIAGLPTVDLRVTSSAPSAGGSVAYSVVVRGDRIGEGTVKTEMTASGVPGVTIVRDTIAVTRE